MNNEYKILKRVPLFSGMDVNVIKNIYSTGSNLYLQRGEKIRYDPEAALYLVVKGNIKLLTHDETGNEKMKHITKDDFFGTLAILDGTVIPVEFIAEEDSEIHLIKRSDFIDFLKGHPDITINILKKIINILRTVNKELSTLYFYFLYPQRLN